MKKYVDGFVCALGNQHVCFESSLSVSDWASWVQAVGSIGAILAAAGIVLWQHRLAAARDREIALERHADAVRTISDALNEAAELLKSAKANAIAKTFFAATEAGLAFHFIEMGDLLDSLIQNDISDPSVRVRVKDATYALNRARNDLFRDFPALERGEKLEPGLDPYAQTEDGLRRIENALAALSKFDTRRRALLR